MKTRKIDNLLQEWAARTAPDNARVQRISEGISRALAGERLLPVEQISAISEPWPLWGRLAYAAAGAAIAFAVSAWLFVSGVVGPKPVNGGAVELAQIPSRQLETRTVLFEEVECLFAGRVRWVATSADDVQLGLVSGAEAAEPASEPMMVRLVVLKKAAGGDSWQEVWDADVLTRSQEFVELTPNPGVANNLAIWVYPNSDGTVVVESHISLMAPVQIASSTSSVVHPGRPVEILSMKTGDGEYRVYQTVVPLGRAGTGQASAPATVIASERSERGDPEAVGDSVDCFALRARNDRAWVGGDV